MKQVKDCQHRCPCGCHEEGSSMIHCKTCCEGNCKICGIPIQFGKMEEHIRVYHSDLKTNIPKVNIDEVADGIIGVQAAIMAAISRFGEAMVSFFLDIVPERGSKLWDKFRNYQHEKGDKRDFLDFIGATIDTNSIKIFYPKECTLDLMTRQLLSETIQKGIKSCDIKTNEEILQIYFGEGKVYNTARQISCKGCPKKKCRHNLGSTFRRK